MQWMPSSACRSFGAEQPAFFLGLAQALELVKTRYGRTGRAITR
jgi:hypothetical protein